jgi:hypothetical protein
LSFNGLFELALRNSLVRGAALSSTLVFASAAASAASVYERVGVASWYGAREAGHRTASGRIFGPDKPSAAHRTLPLGSCVSVTRLANRRSITVEDENFDEIMRLGGFFGHGPTAKSDVGLPREVQLRSGRRTEAVRLLDSASCCALPGKSCPRPAAHIAVNSFALSL